MDVRIAEQRDEIESLLAILREDAKHRWWRILWRGGTALFLLIGLLHLLEPIAGIGSVAKHLYNPAGIIAAYFGWLAYNTPQQKRAFAVLAEMNDMRAIAPLVEAKASLPRETKASKAVTDTLIHLLSYLREGDGWLLDARCRRQLRQALTGDANAVNGVDYLITVLKAFEKVGGQEELPVVVKLAEGKGLAKKNPSLQQAAQECLPFLRQHIEDQRATQTLLRASDAQNLPDTTLLRPTETSPEVQPELLLRAANEQQG